MFEILLYNLYNSLWWQFGFYQNFSYKLFDSNIRSPGIQALYVNWAIGQSEVRSIEL